jgi:hypothetical protein
MAAAHGVLQCPGGEGLWQSRADGDAPLPGRKLTVETAPRVAAAPMLILLFDISHDERFYIPVSHANRINHSNGSRHTGQGEYAHRVAAPARLAERPGAAVDLIGEAEAD